jgi:hypothetical protein
MAKIQNDVNCKNNFQYGTVALSGSTLKLSL